MEKLATQRGIEIVKIPPGHPAPNNVETFMKPLSKAMKAEFTNKEPEKKILSELLKSYSDTPHPATGVAPGAMIFRDGYQVNFPRTKLTEDEVANARLRDLQKRDQRKVDTNN